MTAVTLTALPTAGRADSLPSWNDGPTKRAILEFVGRVTADGGPDFVPTAERVAVFDNDGTLWCEKPLYVHLFANEARFQQLMKADPTRRDRQPYKAVAARDPAHFIDLLERGETNAVIGDLFGEPFRGLSTDDFAAWNRQWLSTWKHPRFDVGHRGLVYQPMLELIRLLQNNGFDVHIFTADEGAFVKLVSEELYGIPRRNVHGSSINLEFQVDGNQPRLIRTNQAAYLNNWDGKPRLIQQAIGRRPIFAAGNSNGDLQMLRYVAPGPGSSMSVLVRHTDAEREYAYDGHTDKALPLAREAGWTIVSIKDDWKIVFPD